MQKARATRVLATIFHKHKYISIAAVTLADAVIAAARNLASALKVKTPHYLQECLLAKLTRLSEIFYEATVVSEIPDSHMAPLASQTPQP